MTPFAAAIESAEKGVYAWDERYKAEVRDTHNHIRNLFREGYSAAQIAVRVGMCRRQVERIKTKPDIDYPHPLPARVSERRATEMDQAADAVMELACRLRDENPALTWNALWRMDRVALQKVCMVALAGIDPDTPVAELFGWVLDLPVAREVAA